MNVRLSRRVGEHRVGHVVVLDDLVDVERHAFILQAQMAIDRDELQRRTVRVRD